MKNLSFTRWLFAGAAAFEAIDPQTIHLIERWRADVSPTLTNDVFYRGFLEPGVFVMERRRLLGIKERAERLATMSN